MRRPYVAFAVAVGVLAAMPAIAVPVAFKHECTGDAACERGCRLLSTVAHRSCVGGRALLRCTRAGGAVFQAFTGEHDGTCSGNNSRLITEEGCAANGTTSYWWRCEDDEARPRSARGGAVAVPLLLLLLLVGCCCCGGCWYARFRRQRRRAADEAHEPTARVVVLGATAPSSPSHAPPPPVLGVPAVELLPAAASSPFAASAYGQNAAAYADGAPSTPGAGYTQEAAA